jgi:NADH dehydrogenase [ubiquinone] 1 alpha subcomplex assembly factor 7
MTPLEERLLARIRADGPMTVADYMTACLNDPHYGYYATREPFGTAGDFTTAPEISQMFGELIGLWAVATWEAMGSPKSFILSELGPGRGTLMADALRAAKVRPEFGAAAHGHLVETSGRLRNVQRTTLGRAETKLAWHDSIAAVPPGPMILIANEFFDALPIHQFVATAFGWAERMVGTGADGRLAYLLRPRADASQAIEAPQGSLREVSPAATAIMAMTAERLVKHGGAAPVIDYGYVGPAFGDTLQAVRSHGYHDPLAAPGEADLTAHVDFGALAAEAKRAGAIPRPVMTQGEFLKRMGLRERAEVLARGKNAATADAVAAAAERLAGPEAMGDLFKVLAVSSPGLALPVFDG